MDCAQVRLRGLIRAERPVPEVTRGVAASRPLGITRTRPRAKLGKLFPTSPLRAELEELS